VNLIVDYELALREILNCKVICPIIGIMHFNRDRQRDDHRDYEPDSRYHSVYLEIACQSLFPVVIQFGDNIFIRTRTVFRNISHLKHFHNRHLELNEFLGVYLMSVSRTAGKIGVVCNKHKDDWGLQPKNGIRDNMQIHLHG
jgi:hypothetical protein